MALDFHVRSAVPTAIQTLEEDLIFICTPCSHLGDLLQPLLDVVCRLASLYQT